MHRQEYKLDLKPEGPWPVPEPLASIIAAEPDLVTWVDTLTGYQCIVLRHFVTGCWNGYVIVPVDSAVNDDHQVVERRVRVHGGITYQHNAWFSGIPELAKIKVSRQMGDIVGFDTSHYNDIVPFIAGTGGALLKYGVYRTVKYAQAETRSLAQQLHAMRHDVHYKTHLLDSL